MKKKTSNLAVTAGNEEYLSLEQRILRSDLSEQDKIELIKIIGRQGTGNYGWSTCYPLNLPQTISGHSDCPQPTVTYCSCCCEE